MTKKNAEKSCRYMYGVCWYKFYQVSCRRYDNRSILQTFKISVLCIAYCTLCESQRIKESNS